MSISLTTCNPRSGVVVARHIARRIEIGARNITQNRRAPAPRQGAHITAVEEQRRHCCRCDIQLQSMLYRIIGVVQKHCTMILGRELLRCRYRHPRGRRMQYGGERNIVGSVFVGIAGQTIGNMVQLRHTIVVSCHRVLTSLLPCCHYCLLV